MTHQLDAIHMFGDVMNMFGNLPVDDNVVSECSRIIRNLVKDQGYLLNTLKLLYRCSLTFPDKLPTVIICNSSISKHLIPHTYAVHHDVTFNSAKYHFCCKNIRVENLERESGILQRLAKTGRSFKYRQEEADYMVEISNGNPVSLHCQKVVSETIEAWSHINDGI